MRLLPSPRILALATSLLASLGCSSASSGSGASPAPAPQADAGPASTGPTANDAGEAGALPTPTCGAPPAASHCKNEGSWVRGVVYFDPSHFAQGATPMLRLSLRHGFVLVKGEEKIGGRLHAYKSIRVKDVSAGQVEFALDMCDLGTAMWSEENGSFHLVASLDENGNNDLDDATSNEDAVTRGTPDPGELTKMIDVDVSCNAPSPCVALQLDCVDGAACTTITPLKTCAKKTPGCASDDAWCK
jgi:hypothetical protein